MQEWIALCMEPTYYARCIGTGVEEAVISETNTNVGQSLSSNISYLLINQLLKFILDLVDFQLLFIIGVK